MENWVFHGANRAHHNLIANQLLFLESVELILRGAARLSGQITGMKCKHKIDRLGRSSLSGAVRICDRWLDFQEIDSVCRSS